jgi:hypothetical protein
MRRQITHSNVVYSVSKFHTNDATNVVNYFDCLRRIGPHATFMISWYLPQKWVRIVVKYTSVIQIQRKALLCFLLQSAKETS